MKFLVDEFPRFGYDCPFFSRGYCHDNIPRSDVGVGICPIFNHDGHRKIDAVNEQCICLKEFENRKETINESNIS